MAAPLGVGERVHDRYLIEAQGVSGGMGRVYRALDESSGQTVALKLLHRLADAQRFRRESMALAALHAEAVVCYSGHGVTADGDAFLAMEWLEGEDLGARIESGPLGVADVITLGRRLCEGLAAIHEVGLLHRDLKPANVMLVGGECARATIVDLGLARRQSGGSWMTRAGAILGTVGYMSPEQARGQRELTGATDLFSLGCVLHECLTGVPAFEGANAAAVLAKVLIGEPAPLAELRPDVPASLTKLIARLLEKEPGDRGGDAAQVGRVMATLMVDADAAAPIIIRRAVGTNETRVVSALLIAPPLSSAADDTIVADSSAATPDGILTTIDAYGGRASTLAGDMVIVQFGESGSAAERASRAALCALALVESHAHHRIALSMGRSSSTGQTLSAGALERALDRAVTLIGLAEPGEITIDEPSARLLGGHFVFTATASGLRLVGQNRSGEHRGGRLLGNVVPFVGRRKEIAFLQALLEDVVEEESAQVVIVSANPGAGKSRLATALRDAVPVAVRTLYATTTPLSVESSGALARSLVLDGIGVQHPRAEQLSRYVLELGLVANDDAGALEEAAFVAEFLGELLGLSNAAPSPKLIAARRDAHVMANRVSKAFVMWLRAEARLRPLLLVLEDTHWADRVSLGYIDLALRTGPAILGLALTRPEGREELERVFERHVPHALELRPLSDRAAEKIARAALHQPGDTVIDDILCRAAGNPFFLEELVRAVAAGQDEIPDTVLALAEDRVGRLEPELRQVLRAASVFGQRCWVAGVARVAGLADVASVVRDLDRLVDAELLVRSPSSRLLDQVEYRFVHALPRDAVYGMIPDRERVGAHALVASWLESAGETDTATLAEHHTLAGDRERALHWRVVATKQAFIAGNYRAVIRHIELAAPLEPDGEHRTELLTYEARSAVFAGEYRAAARASSEAMARLPAESDAWVGMVGCLAWCSLQIGDTVGLGIAMVALGDPSRIQRGTSDHALAMGAFLSANMLAFGPEAARPFQRAARRIADSGGRSNHVLQGWAQFCDGWMAWYADDPEAPLQLLEATVLFERSDDLMGYENSLVSSAFAEAVLGRSDALEEIVGRARELGEEHGLWSAFPIALLLQATFDIGTDDTRAEALVGEARAFADDNELVMMSVQLASASRNLVHGEWDACRTAAKKLARGPMYEGKTIAAVLEGCIALARGEAREAATIADRARAMLEPMGSPMIRTLLADLDLSISVNTGDRVRAKQLAGQALARHTRRAAVLPHEDRHLYWANSPFVARAKVHIDQVLNDRAWTDERPEPPQRQPE